jgi:ribosomal protein L4
LSAVLSDLCASKSLVIIESLPVSKGTTKEFIKLLKDCGLAGKKVGLLCGANSDPKQVRAARNVTGVSIFSAAGVNPWELLKVDAVLGEKAVFDSLQQELVGRVSEVSARRNRRAVPGVAKS